MKIYTKTGDKGETSLVGGKRVPKDSLIVGAYGAIDELNSSIGVAMSFFKDSLQELKAGDILRRVQNDLFTLGAEVSASNEIGRNLTSIPRTTEDHIRFLEESIDLVEEQIGLPTSFILPNGSKQCAHLHQARTICRRAERIVIAAARETPISQNVIVYLNRLSDLLFMLARFVNEEKETAPNYGNA